jgi:hypothetical protein
MLIKIQLSRTCHEGTEGEWRYIATQPRPRRWIEVGGQRHAPAALSSGKNPDIHWTRG